MRYERAPLLPAGLVQRKRADLQRAREYVLSNVSTHEQLDCRTAKK